MDTIIYSAFNNIYINLTNKCSNNCDFCIRNGKEGVYGSNSLWLDNEPTSLDVINKLKSYKDFKTCNEVVFCGFGEPTYKVLEIQEISRFLKMHNKKVRLNTNGQGNLINGRDVTEILANCCDFINISLNAPTPKEYQEICVSEFGETAFSEMLDFAKKLNKLNVKTVFSVVDTIGAEKIKACEMIANECGVELKVREFEE